MKILAVGDTHGNIWDMKRSFRIAKEYQCEEIHIVGDFGCFPNLPRCKEFLETVSFTAISENIRVSFTDGNHENHHFLRDRFKENSDIFVLPGIEWKYRGKYWDKFVSFGGAYSIDKAYRTLGLDWFENETISEIDLYRLDKECDIMFSHDCPFGIDFGFIKDDPNTISNRNALLAACEIVKPKILIHGHYHKFHDSILKMSYGDLRIIGLDRDEKLIKDHYVILNNGNLEFLQ